MNKNSEDKIDIEEIRKHVLQLETYTKDKKKSTQNKINKNDFSTSTQTTTLKQPSENTISKKSKAIHITISNNESQNWSEQSKSICDICKNEIVLGKHLSGLVIDDHYFACETCCQNSTNNELLNWSKSRMNNPSNFSSIGLWLTQNKTKNRTILFKK